MRRCTRLIVSSCNYVLNSNKLLSTSHTKVMNPSNKFRYQNTSLFSTSCVFAKSNNTNLKSAYTADQETVASTMNIEDPLKHPDYFGIEKLVTIEDLFNARVHYGHKKGSRNEHMKPYLFGCRLDVDIFDLDQTIVHMHKALNILAHIAYRKGIILFIMKSHQFGHMVEQLALDCGEYAHTRDWKLGTFANMPAYNRNDPSSVRLPDLCVFLSSQGAPYQSHQAVIESAKVGIITVGVCDSNVNPTIISYPIPGNDDTLESIELYCRLFKKAVLLGKHKRIEDDRKRELAESRRTQIDASTISNISQTSSFLQEIDNTAD